MKFEAFLQKGTKCHSLKHTTLYSLDNVSGIKLNMQPAIVSMDNKTSGADSLKVPHQLSQLPNYM